MRCARVPVLAALVVVLALACTSAVQRAGALSAAPRVTPTTLDSEVSQIEYFRVRDAQGNQHVNVVLLTEQGRVWVSEDEGRTWAVRSALGNVIRMSRADTENAAASLFVVGGNALNYMSSDGGHTFATVRAVPGVVEQVAYHPRANGAVLVITEVCAAGSCTKKLYATMDAGATWRMLSGGGVMTADWEQRAVVGAGTQSVLASVEVFRAPPPSLISAGWSGNVNLFRFDANTGTNATVVVGGYTFAALAVDEVDGGNGFVFVAQVNATTNRVGLLSSRDGRVFTRVRLPTALEENGYTLLDSSEGAIFLHVNHGAFYASRGNLYLSGAEGVRYALSLENQNRDMSGTCDFLKVDGLQGVYIANTYVNGQTRTRITYDKGGSWTSIAPSDVAKHCKDQQGDACKLHLYGQTMAWETPYYTSANAPGIILATGNVGTHLSNSHLTEVWLSRNAGVDWVRVHETRSRVQYEFGDHGAVIVIVEAASDMTDLLYSFDQGAHWNLFQYTNVSTPASLSGAQTTVTPSNIVSAPNSTSLQFIVYGSAETVDDDDVRTTYGVVYHIDFTDTLRTCAGRDTPDLPDSDFETWTPVDATLPGESCLLGQRVTYVRRKATAQCSIGPDHEHIASITTCPCTESDWECDYAFYRETPTGPCVPQPDVPQDDDGIPDFCPVGTMYHEINGYRLVAGNRCSGGVNHFGALHACPSPPGPVEQHVGGIIAAIVIVILAVAVGLLSWWQRDRIKAIAVRLRDSRPAVFGRRAPGASAAAPRYRGLRSEEPQEDNRLLEDTDDFHLDDGVDSDADVKDFGTTFASLTGGPATASGAGAGAGAGAAASGSSSSSAARSGAGRAARVTPGGRSGSDDDGEIRLPMAPVDDDL